VRTSLETVADRSDAGAPRSARVYSVSSGRPFLAAIASAILKGDLPVAGGPAPAPLNLPDITLLLPTRRAARAMQEAFLEAGGGGAMLLPQIRPISEGEEELTLLISLAGESALGPEALELPPAASDIERRLVLTELVLKWSKVMRDAASSDAAAFLGEHATAVGASTPAQAAHLAADLASLMDMIETENVALDGLAQLVPEEYSAHWQQTLQFLEIVTAMWPAYLTEKGLLSPAERRNRGILSEAGRLSNSPPAGPVIVAGVTGSIPATVELMRAVGALPQGAIVLPGLDTHLDAESWTQISDHPEHPQFGLKKLLDSLGVDRAGVRDLEGSEPSAPGQARATLVSEAMRPSGTTGRWRSYTQAADREALRAALDRVSLIEAPTAQDEAETIALILREAAEYPGRTAALVSPDRLLARRVAVRLKTWGIEVDDSAGRPFAKTPPGTFLDLVISAIAKDFAPAETMALLKHPLTRLGLGAFSIRRAARNLELAVFRDIYLGKNLENVETALVRIQEAERKHPVVKRIRPDHWRETEDLVQRLKQAFAPLVAVFASKAPLPLQAIAKAHVETAEALCRLPDEDTSEDDGSPLWRNEAGAVASAFFADLYAPGLPEASIEAGDYPDLYRSLIVGLNVRPRVAVHPRLFIWGPFEARLQQTDVMILGSLNDGTWPEAADPGPWLNRPMRQELGLPSPEEKIGYAAHDFTSFLGAPRVYLTRAQKIDGVPTVASRWLMRLQALLTGMELTDALHSSEPWLGWALSRDVCGKRTPISAPEPRPPIALRPRQMSVTRIETWLANPYAIFARDILKLAKLPDLGASPDAALRGSIVHAIMSGFAERFPDRLGDDLTATLERLAEEAMAEFAHNPRVAAFWLPRFKRFADWFAETEPARRRNIDSTVAEVTGALVIAAAGGPFTLTARADRIDIGADGLVITDYKTGTPPNDKKVVNGMAPQLPLEAAIATAGSGFTRVATRPVTALRYIHAKGGEPPGDERNVKAGDVAALAEAAVAQLTRLVSHFDDEATPYKAMRRARFRYDFDDYAHLARAAEWAGAEEEEDEAS
jgi:ATP-dependent helicase/nuclease subunit B